MLERWLISIVISFVLRQLAKFKQDVDWGKVRADMDARIRALVPGSWFDNEAVALCNSVLDGVIFVLGSSESIETILRLLAESKWEDAAAALKDLLMSVWIPRGASAVKAVSLLKAA